MMLHMMDLSPTEAGYMTLTKAAKEAIWLNGLAIKSGFELKIVAGIATCALSKAIPDVAPNVGGLDDHVMMDEQSAKGQYVGSSGTQSPAFISADISVGTTHNAAEGTAAPLWLEARYNSLLVAYQDLQTKVATLHRERNDAELKSNEFQGMVLHRDGNIK
ncbi:hypothetical protein Tco_1473203, partial [Tanacetum coccineum]